MKHKKLKIWLIVIVIVAGVIGIKVGIDHHNEKEYMVSVVEKNEHVVYKDLKADDGFNRVKDIEIDYKHLSYNEMGGINVPGMVNNDKELAFNVNVYKEEDKGKIVPGPGVYSSKLGDLMTDK